MRLALLLLVLATVGLWPSGASAGAPSGAGATFARGTLNAVITSPTSLDFGPDGRLYVAGLSEIHALTLDTATHAVLDDETIASGLDSVLGIAFDPTAPASPVVVYASNVDTGATGGFQGRVSTFTAPGWQQADVITGLPTSIPFTNHLTNGITFDDTGRLFIAQGSQTDAGLANPFYPETPLSAAVLIADLSAPGFDGAITYDPAEPPASDEVDQVSGDVDVFAAGVRNPYDVVVHSNGLVYATDNGPTGGSYSATCSTSDSPSNTSDELNLIEEGNYYGFPNRNRGRFDVRQCTYRPASEPSGSGYTAPIAVLPSHCSCDGIAEYTSGAFAGALQGDLIYAEFIRGNVTRAVLSDDGRSVLSTPVLAGGFSQPLDVAVGPDGTIYVAEHGANRVSYLTPSEAPVGDANCDGSASALDALLDLQLVVGLLPDVPCPATADADQDGDIDAIDATLVLQYVIGLLPSLPPP
jgi:glucose/arabinose dehydrogenase